MITLGNAAKQLRISKPTLSKAISKGHLSAAKREDGSFAIDPSELMRWWEGVKHRFQPLPVSHLQEATGSETIVNPTGTPPETELLIRNAQLEAELLGMKELIRVHKDQIEDLRSERDKLLGQVDSAHRLLTHNKLQKPTGLFAWFKRSS